MLQSLLSVQAVRNERHTLADTTHRADRRDRRRENRVHRVMILVDSNRILQAMLALVPTANHLLNSLNTKRREQNDTRRRSTRVVGQQCRAK